MMWALLKYRLSKIRYRITMKKRQLFVLSTFAIFVYVGSHTFDSSHSQYNRKIIKKTKLMSSPPIWSYKCDSKKCIKVRGSLLENGMSLESCEMLCDGPSLWPMPKKIIFNDKKSSIISRDHMHFTLDIPHQIRRFTMKAVDTFVGNIGKIPLGRNISNFADLRITINIENDDPRLRISTNESYTLSIKKADGPVEVYISSPTCFGARHALETLSQLIWYDSINKNLNIIHDIIIEDKPAFPHRGLMIDTARNFFPIRQLMRVIDGMAACKLNVLHLHLTDAVSFPINLPSNPNFAKYGAYSKSMVYSPGEMKGLIKYASNRGIRTILEVDAPSHVHEGWNYQDNEADKLIICDEDDIMNGHLNPENARVPDILKNMYQDLLYMGTDNETFHIGNDEVNTTCFRATNKSKAGIDPIFIWIQFTNQMLEIIKSANRNNMPENVVIWSSPLTDRYLHYLNHTKNLVIQFWFGLANTAFESGVKIIFSTVGKWYLDCGFGSWKPGMANGVCDPFTPWQTFYQFRPWEEYFIYLSQVLGGEVCLWTEMVDADSLETRIWPRTAAFAERIWTDPRTFDEDDVYKRLAWFRELLKLRGVRSSAIWPKYCTQNPGSCRQH